MTAETQWKHWLTRYDPDDGEPYGTVCECPVGKDHDGAGNGMGFDDDETPDTLT